MHFITNLLMYINDCMEKLNNNANNNLVGQTAHFKTAKSIQWQ